MAIANDEIQLTIGIKRLSILEEKRRRAMNNLPFKEILFKKYFKHNNRLWT